MPHNGASDEEEKDYITINEKNGTLDVPKKETDIVQTPEVEDSEDGDDNVSTNKGQYVRIQKYHPIENVIGDLNEGIITRSKEVIANMCFISKIEPKNVKEALTDEYWINSMQKDLFNLK